MGSVHSYETRQGKRYLVSYRDPKNKQVMKRGFTRKVDATNYLATVTVAKATGDYIAPTAGRVTIGQLGPSWLEGQRGVLKASTYRSIDSAWRIHVEPKWGADALADIEFSTVQAWVSTMAGTHSATTVLRAHGVLSGIIDTAVRDRKIARNVAREGLKLPEKTGKPRLYLSHRQVERLANASSRPTLVYFLAYTGLRWGEATGLRVQHLDLDRRRVLVESNAVMVGGEIVVGTPKNDKSRSVPFPRFLTDKLADAAKGKAPSDLLFDYGGRHLQLPNSRDGWFAAAVKRLQRADQKAIADAAERGDEQIDRAVFPKLTPHDLRHTAASLAISAGANAKAVQRMLGHKSAAMTLDVYADLFDDDLDAVADALDRARLS